MQIKKGTTRTVLLIGNYAIKIARFWTPYKGHKWKMFLRGILANIDESFWYSVSLKKNRLCPVKWKSPLILILIMERAEEYLPEDYTYTNEDLYKIFKDLPLDLKKENFGILKNGEIVLVDYADSKYNCSDCSYNFKNR